MMHHTFRTLLAACLLLLPSCALFGGGEANFDRAERYRLSPPNAWHARSRESSDKAYQTPQGSIVTVTSSCNRNASAPLSVLTRHLMLGMRDIKFKKQEEIAIADTKGLLSEVAASMEGKKFELALFVVSLKACIFDFTLINPKQLSRGEVSEFRNFVRSLKYGTN